MDNINSHKGWILGKGLIIDMGYMSGAEVLNFKNMSSDARKLFVDEYMAKYPEAFKSTAGYCQDKKVHVSERECLQCAQKKGWTAMVQWNACRGEKLSRF